MLYRLVFAIVFLFGSFTTAAHDVFSGEAKAVITENKQLTLELNLAAVSVEAFLQDFPHRNNRLTPENLPKVRGHLLKKASDFFLITLDNRQINPNNIDFKVFPNEDAVKFYFEYPGPFIGNLSVFSKFIEQTNQEYKLTFTLFNAYNTQLGLFVHSYQDKFSGVTLTGNENEPNYQGVFSSFFKLGIEHILEGYDHLLFLLALLIICRNWKDAALIITCFTFAHSITLSLAALELVSVSANWVELIIALTIIYVGLENLYFKHKPKHRWVLTSTFGLIHGLGFANVLLGLGLGSTGAPIFLPLLAFNLGVEIGQLLLSALVLPLLWYLFRFNWYKQAALPMLSIAIVATGSFWAFERLIV
ncbi:HupE/UreJ family protein [Catenovulum sp. SX2]|uniref:HupE/UreJ family protein n=1 Tax=Catenovulum sp. SX2 TaxID=3398614 RepID=UPI003F8759F9